MRGAVFSGPSGGTGAYLPLRPRVVDRIPAKRSRVS